MRRLLVGFDVLLVLTGDCLRYYCLFCVCGFFVLFLYCFFFFFSSRRRHTRCLSDWSSDVCSSDLSFFRRAKSWLKESSRLAFLRNAARRSSALPPSPNKFSKTIRGWASAGSGVDRKSVV